MANMLLFLTLEAFLRFSIEDRFFGEEIGGLSVTSLAGEEGSRPCQNKRGEVVEKGEDPAGEFSLPKSFPCTTC